ncbi:hypothetical protein [Streptomyces sp. NPDC059278]|uniref:hypothetical protein n=1 Tax=Streptomyces sp. NPDC059278 TaxID=3346801 RepID=UPI0036C5FA4A
MLDPQLSESLSDALGHHSPVTFNDLAPVTELAIKYCRDIAPLRKAQNLKIAILIGCDPVSTSVFSGLGRLNSLTIQDSGLRTVHGLTNPALQKLTLARGFIEDLATLTDLQQPCVIDVTGNPLSRSSYEEVIPELRRRGHRVKASGEIPWRVSHRLHSEGIPISRYRGTEGYRLCRPGLSSTEYPDYSHPLISADQARELLTGDPRRAHSYFERDDLLPRLLPR